MADSRDFYRRVTDATSAGPDDDRADYGSRTDEQMARRARYLAKAASLGQVVAEDDPPDIRHP
jgi:hypothetical protein